MNDILFVILGVMIPFLGTSIGAMSAVFVNGTNKKVESMLYGFSAGVMVSASIFSLLIPSIESTKLNPKWLIPLTGLTLGALFMIFIDFLSEKKLKNITRSKKIVLAITCHNLPEGMAVGVAIASALSGKAEMIPALILALGIGVQNIPEGAIISLPLVGAGESKAKSIMLAFFSAIVELIGAIIAILISSVITKLLPFFLSFSAGAMIWVTVKELIPETKGTLSAFIFIIGFALMMVLDLM